MTAADLGATCAVNVATFGVEMVVAGPGVEEANHGVPLFARMYCGHAYMYVYVMCIYVCWIYVHVR